MEVNQENRYDIAPETRLWRYMSFAKFISLLNLKQLLYVPAFRFNDPFEGACGIYQTQADNNAVSLENLIENVYISPYAESWFKSLVEEELKKHNLHIKPIQSALNAQPMYEEIVI